jgi:hypothetical protein
MQSTIDILRSATLYINIYFGLFICITGIVGGFLNIIVFTTLKTFRQTTCVVYLITASIAGLGQSLTVLVRVFSTGFNYGPISSSILCKFRFFLSQYFSLIFLTCMCMATIDQYLSMTKYRQLNNMRLARYHITFICIFLFIQSIFSFIFYDTNGSACIMTNNIFAKYYTYFYIPVLLGFLPITINGIFTLLALHKIIKISNRQINIIRLSRDRQLTAMALVHVLFLIITLIPFIIFFIYTLTTTAKDTEEAARNQLIYAITTLFGYGCYAVNSFYFQRKIFSSFFLVSILYLLFCIKTFS